MAVISLTRFGPEATDDEAPKQCTKKPADSEGGGGGGGRGRGGGSKVQARTHQSRPASALALSKQATQPLGVKPWDPLDAGSEKSERNLKNVEGAFGRRIARFDRLIPHVIDKRQVL